MGTSPPSACVKERVILDKRGGGGYIDGEEETKREEERGERDGGAIDRQMIHSNRQ